MNAGLLVLAVLFGVAGFLEARRFGREHGRTPWGWDPWVWGLVMFLSFLIGVILIAIAERQGRKAAPVASYGGYGAQPPPYASTGQPQVGAVAPAAPAAPAAPSAGMWAPDPSGRFEYRWWDGQQWTASVSRGGVTSQDPPV